MPTTHQNGINSSRRKHRSSRKPTLSQYLTRADMALREFFARPMPGTAASSSPSGHQRRKRRRSSQKRTFSQRLMRLGAAVQDFFA